MLQLQRLSPCGAPGLHLLRRIAPPAARLAAASLQHATRRRIRQTPVLSAPITAPIMALLLAALLLAACGGGDAPPASGTPNTERTEREQTVAQQTTEPRQQQTEAEQSTASQPAEQPDPQPDPQPEAVAQQQDAAAPPDQPAIEAEVEDESQQTITFDDQMVEQIAADLAAHRAGLPTARNALGDPAAPVLIVEYGDFQ